MNVVRARKTIHMSPSHFFRFAFSFEWKEWKKLSLGWSKLPLQTWAICQASPRSDRTIKTSLRDRSHISHSSAWYLFIPYASRRYLRGEAADGPAFSRFFPGFFPGRRWSVPNMRIKNSTTFLFIHYYLHIGFNFLKRSTHAQVHWRTVYALMQQSGFLQRPVLGVSGFCCTVVDISTIHCTVRDISAVDCAVFDVSGLECTQHLIHVRHSSEAKVLFF